MPINYRLRLADLKRFNCNFVHHDEARKNEVISHPKLSWDQIPHRIMGDKKKNVCCFLALWPDMYLMKTLTITLKKKNFFFWNEDL